MMILNFHVYWDNAGALPFINKKITIVENAEDTSTLSDFIHCEILSVRSKIKYGNKDIKSIKFFSGTRK